MRKRWQVARIDQSISDCAMLQMAAYLQYSSLLKLATHGSSIYENRSHPLPSKPRIRALSLPVLQFVNAILSVTPFLPNLSLITPALLVFFLEEVLPQSVSAGQRLLRFQVLGDTEQSQTA